MADHGERPTGALLLVDRRRAARSGRGDRELAALCRGIAIGWCLAILAGRSLDFLLFEVSSTDATSLAASPLLIAALSVLATGLPAWKASALDPTQVLRSE